MDLKEGSRAEAVFAGGCFWCIESAFSDLDGVYSVTPGYAGGTVSDPSYAQVARGTTGHRESVLVVYDPTKLTYEELLDVFWRQIDPTDAGGQFADRGSQYTTAIFYGSEREKRLAEDSKRALAESGRFSDPIVTEILPAGRFWIAEDEHKGYSKNHPFQYKAYYEGSGRGAFCRRVWKKR